MEVKIGSMVRFYTVLLLRDGPRHGYDLMHSLEGRLGARIGASQVYPFLSKLEGEGLVTVARPGARGKKVYRLTRKGERFVDGFLGRFGDLIHFAIEPNLTVCAHCGCKLYEGGHREKVGGRERMFCCCHCAHSYTQDRSVA